MTHGVDGGLPLEAHEVRQVEATSRALSKVPACAPIADVFDAIRPCVPLAAGLFGIIRPGAPDAMVIRPVRLPPEVFDTWLGTPRDQLMQTLAPVVLSKAGDLWRDSETVTGALREQLDVLRKLDAAGLGEGAGYKVLERTSPWQGVEHFLLAMVMERGSPIPPRSGAMLAALKPAISAAILRIGLTLSESDSIRAQMMAERSTGYICLSRGGAVLEANRRAHDLVVRFRAAARVEGGRGAVEDFAARAREQAARGQAWRLSADDPPSLLDVSVHLLAKEAHSLPEDVLLVVMNEVLLPPSSADDILRRAGLTPSETKIALLLARTSASCKEIAAGLSRSEGTVRTHVQNIYTKLGVRSRPELTERLKK